MGSGLLLKLVRIGKEAGTSGDDRVRPTSSAILALRWRRVVGGCRAAVMMSRSLKFLVEMLASKVWFGN
ncbi:hypothetical protein NPIL_238171 [Nephila pilipes]|uniref:Uncharacterized protein n=1 Tax=Nephila pilipes TaxID=299642 RepID=A0A8X6U4Q2_NEPPI|nr:hypothetical protein NPIL_238171 [Nephila pilipes]